ncbi:TetR family transcriptional regulator [Nonomuraea sp. NPDC049158]|uniref:TetR/AcrR family transcriptional regulator n=1 Tax=Nonomuraea sp. NPDC049158 TaxID=3155649 RepID=UPI0033EF20D0
MIAETASLRERRRAETRRTLQTHAVRLFMARGYDATTINDVAEAAGVSAMTLYRHFATKEDLVLYDEFDRETAAALAAQQQEEPLRQRIGRALVQTAATAVNSDRDLLLARLNLMISTPALQARHLDSQYATEIAVVDTLCAGTTDPDLEFRIRSTTAACLAVIHVALIRWAEGDGRQDLPTLMRQALTSAFDTAF